MQPESGLHVVAIAVYLCPILTIANETIIHNGDCSMKAYNDHIGVFNEMVAAKDKRIAELESVLKQIADDDFCTHGWECAACNISAATQALGGQSCQPKE